MSEYSYSSLSPEPYTIRLLRILPSNEASKNVRCELFEYTLRISDTAVHPYEALSYVWGSKENAKAVEIDNRTISVANNLYTALLRFRDPKIPRIIWADAICINQKDQREKESQIQLMAAVYAKASRVIVWLGQAEDGGDRALETIRRVGESSTSDPELPQREILLLLQRPWFQRIWVLQEVAAARHVLIICGSAEVDGHAFCLGIGSLSTRLPNFVCPITYIIRGAIFRYGRISMTQERISLGISSLGELIDMYQAHKATERHDKVYALLGMSSDDLSATGIKPNYAMPWEELLKQVIKYVLSDSVSIQTQKNKDAAIIKGKGYVLGNILSVQNNVGIDNSQRVIISWGTMPPGSEDGNENSAPWIIQTLARPVKSGDLVCFLQGCSTPTIIRVFEDISYMVTIAPTPPKPIRKRYTHGFEWLKYLQMKNPSTRDFTLIWDWTYSPETMIDLGTFQAWAQVSNWALKNSPTEADGHLERAARLWNSAFMLADGRVRETVEEKLQGALGSYEMAFRSKDWHTMNDVHGPKNRYDTASEFLLLRNEGDRALMQSRYKWTPLSGALKGGHESVIKFIFEIDKAGVNFRDSFSSSTLLSRAAEVGHLDTIERLLQENADVDTTAARENRRIALRVAAGAGHLNVVERLFQEKADVDTSGIYYGRTALQAAAGAGHANVVERLLQEKADVNDVAAEKHGRTALQAAAEGGHLGVVERLLQEKANVNAPAGKYGRTALQAAAEGGHLNVVERLLQEKADVNATPGSYNGITALQAAAGGGYLDVVERLLQEKADVNAAPGEFSGRTALQAAAEGGHLSVVERLLQEKANVNAPAGGYGRTALQVAAGGGYLNVVERLLQEKADVNAAAAENSGRTALQAAAGGGYLNVVERLLQEEADVNATASKQHGRTALQAAAGGGYLDVVERLLQEKADVNAAPGEFSGRTALQAAAEGGHFNVVERLLQEKAYVNLAATILGRTALQAAAEGGHLGVVERLLQEKANVNAPAGKYGRTALQAAAGGGHLNVVERLLQEKADVNATPGSYSGITALQAAAGGGYLDVVERLIQENADVNAPATDHGKTALQAAAEGGHLSVIERLLQEKANVNAPIESYRSTALQAAAAGGHLDVVERLLQEKTDVNAAATENSGRTALQAAAGGGYLDIVERLIQENAEINAPATTYGRTALQAAAEGGHLSVVERLLQEKADVNAAASRMMRRTALQAAAEGGHLSVVRRLLQEKADINSAIADYGRTALEMAEKRGHLNVVECLRQAGVSR